MALNIYKVMKKFRLTVLIKLYQFENVANLNLEKCNERKETEKKTDSFFQKPSFLNFEEKKWV